MRHSRRRPTDRHWVVVAVVADVVNVVVVDVLVIGDVVDVVVL